LNLNVTSTATPTVNSTAAITAAAVTALTVDGTKSVTLTLGPTGGGTAQVTGGEEDVFSNFDNVYGGAGNDTITGNDGDNLIRGGAGDDSLSGGSDGVDTLDYSYVVNPASGFDLELDPNGDGTVSIGAGDTDTFKHFRSVFGGAGADAIAGNDQSNWLAGGGGNDTLTGNGGDDTLDGGAGSDTIIGGTGMDQLSGGADADVFAFSKGDSSSFATNCDKCINA